MNQQTVEKKPEFGEATRVWLKVGLLSFGGPAAQIALMHRVVVDEKKWIDEPRFLHALNFCMLLPGPEAQQLATYIGWILHGWRGGVVAGTLFVLPGFVVIMCLALAYALLQDVAFIPALFFGLKAAVLAIVVQALIRIASKALKTRTSLALAVGAFIALFVLGIPFPLVVLAAGIIGWLMTGSTVETPETTSRSVAQTIPGVITLVSGFVALWSAPILAVGLVFGFESVFVAIGVFMSKMAVVTFGGAYAVLAYVAQQAVETFQWLEPGEMLDGLALAETTPGPLVLVLTFVGVIAAFRDATGMSSVAAAMLGGTIATWVTFVPCFLWIFLAAPYLERLRTHQRLSGALAAITAAVVGVIFNLAVWFGLHVVFAEVGQIGAMPWPEWATLDWRALALSLIAAALVFVVKAKLTTTLGVCAALGFLAVTYL